MTNMRLLVAIPALIGFSLATPRAGAQPQPPAADATVADAVELKNGGYLRGLIVEVAQGSHVSMRLPDGQVRRIPVAEIESAERAGKPLNLAAPSPTPTPGAAPTPDAAPGAAPTPGAAPAPSAAPTLGAAPAPAPGPLPGHRADSELKRIFATIPGPRIRFEALGNRAAFLERRIGDDDGDLVAYHLVCKLPCQVDLPAEDLVPYRVANLRLQPTDWFQVPKHNTRMRVDLASDMWPVWTRSMLVGGFVFGVAGGTMFGINELSGKKPWARDTGLVLAGVGGAFFLTSGLFWLFSPHTSYDVEPAP